MPTDTPSRFGAPPAHSPAGVTAHQRAEHASEILADLTRHFAATTPAEDVARIADAAFDPTSGVLSRLTALVATMAHWVERQTPPRADRSHAYELKLRLGQAVEVLWDLGGELENTASGIARLPATASGSPPTETARATSPAAASRNVAASDPAVAARPSSPSPTDDHAPTRRGTRS